MSDVEDAAGPSSTNADNLLAEDHDSPYTMTEAKLRTKMKRSNSGRLSTQLFAGFIGCLSALSFGMAIGWSAPITHNLYENKRMDEDSIRFGLLAAMMPLGCALGTISWTYLMQKMGPRRALQIQAPIYVLTWWMSMLVHRNVGLVSRFFLGATSIAHVICGEAFLKETVHPTIVKYFRVIISVTNYLGVLMVYMIGSRYDNMIVLGIASGIPVLHFFLLLIVPESPVFLYQNGEKAAEDSLIWYRGKANIHLDLRQIIHDYESYRVDPEAYRYMLYSKVVISATFRLIVVEFLCAFSGFYIFLFYSSKLWNNWSMSNPIKNGVILCSSFAVSKLLWGTIGLIYQPKLRPSLILSVFLVAMQMTLLTTHSVLDHYGIHFARDWLPLVLVIGIIVLSDFSLNQCSRSLIGLYVPHQVFVKVRSICFVLFWIFVFLNVLGFILVRSIYPGYVWFGAIAILEYLGTIYLYFQLVETKGKSLVQVQMDMKGNPIGSRSTYTTR